MKVKDLIELLSQQDPESEVVSSRDAEGNGYSPVEGVYTGYYQPQSSWDGDWLSEIYNDFVEDGETVKAVCIFPLN